MATGTLDKALERRRIADSLLNGDDSASDISDTEDASGDTRFETTTEETLPKVQSFSDYTHPSFMGEEGVDVLPERPPEDTRAPKDIRFETTTKEALPPALSQVEQGQFGGAPRDLETPSVAPLRVATETMPFIGEEGVDVPPTEVRRALPAHPLVSEEGVYVPPTEVRRALPVTPFLGEEGVDITPTAPMVKRAELVRVPPGTAPRAEGVPTPVSGFLGEEGVDVTPTVPAVQRAEPVEGQPPTAPAVKRAEAVTAEPQSDFTNRVGQFTGAMRKEGFDVVVTKQGDGAISYAFRDPNGQIRSSDDFAKYGYSKGSLLAEQYGLKWAGADKPDQLLDQAPKPEVKTEAAPKPAAKEQQPQQVITTNPDGSDFPTRVQAVGNKDPVAFIVHHTSGRGTVDGVVSTLKERGLGVQYVMDRDGNIFETGGPGAQNIKTGWGPKGTGLNNQNVVGMEIIAKDDKDVTPAQKASFARFIAARYPNTQLFGHGEVNPGHKEADEGLSAKAAALALRESGTLAQVAGQPARGASNVQTFDDYAEKPQVVTTGPAARAEPADKLPSGFYKDEDPKSFIVGTVTTFGGEEDRRAYAQAKAAGLSDKEARQLGDNGQGAARLGGLYTPDTYGVAIPREALIAKLGNNPAAWRKARVDIVNLSTGQRIRVPVVDIGPGEGAQSSGIAADFTPKTAKLLGTDGRFAFQIVANAGPDVNKEPDMWGSEQATIARGIDSSTIGRKRGIGISSTPQTDAQAADVTQRRAKLVADQQDIINKLPEMQKSDVQLYKRLEEPVKGVSDAMRLRYQKNLRAEITKEAQDYFHEPDPEKAFQKATSDADFGTVAANVWRKLPGYYGNLDVAVNQAAQASDSNILDRFAKLIHPEATPEQRAKFLRSITTDIQFDDKDHEKAVRSRTIGNLWANLDPQIQAGVDINGLVQSADNVSDPAYQKAQQQAIDTKKAWIEDKLKTDPRLKGTLGEFIADQGAQFLPNITMALLPPGIRESAIAAQTYAQAKDEFRRDHKDWTEEQLNTAASKSTFMQLAPQEVVSLAIGGKLGSLVSGMQPGATRAGTRALMALGGAYYGTAAQQVAANIAAGKPALEGVDMAALGGAIQGIPGAAISAIHGQPPRVRPGVHLGPEVRPGEPPVREEPPPVTGGRPPVRPAPPAEETVRPTEEPVRPVESGLPRGEVIPPPVPHEALSDKAIEERSAPPVRTAQEAQTGMTEQEANAYLDNLSNEVELRNQARAGDIGLLPGNDHPQASIHSKPAEEVGAPPRPPERFSLGAAVPEKGLSTAQGNKVVDTFREQFPHTPPIEVVQNRNELPQHLQDAIAQNAGDHSVEALIHDGKIHVVAGENVSPEQLHKALLEESIGHYGVEQVLGNKFDALAKNVHDTMQGNPQFEALRPLYGNDPRTLAAEYIARTARGQIDNPTIWTRTKAFFNQVARRLGFKRPYSDSELRVLLARARGYLQKGGGRASVAVSPPRFHLRPEGGPTVPSPVDIARPSKEELPGSRWWSPSRLLQGPRWIRSAYDELSRNPHTAPLAAALMHRVDRAQELKAQLQKPIVEAFKGIKKGERKTVLADFAKLQEAKDNKQPQPTGLHPDAYKLERAVRQSSEQVAALAKANKVLVFDPRLNGGAGGYRPFQATADYVPRTVRRDVIDAMRLRHNSPKDLARWTGIIHDFINKGFATNESEVLDAIKSAANLDTRHIDKKMGNLEKARTSRLPSNMYEYSLSGMLDYVRRASDRMSEIEAYGQRGEMFQKTVDRIENSPLKGTEQGNGLINYVKSLRNHELGLNEPTPLGKAMAITRSFSTGLDLSGWHGMFNDLIGSTLQTPMTMGVWNTAKGYMHALTHFKQMMSHAEDLGVIHDDYGRATREIEQEYKSGTFSDKLGRIGSKVAELGLKVSGREAQEKFIRTMTLGAAKQMLRNAVDTIRQNPNSRQAGTWAHYLHRRGVDVSKLVAEGGTGPEADRLLRRAVADTQAGYDLIQRSPFMETPGGKFFGQYMSWGMNQTRNVMREIILPMFRPNQKTIAVKVGDKTFMVKDSRFSAVQRGLMLGVSGAATGLLTDQLKEFFLGRINSYRDLKQLAADIASNPDKSAVFANMVRTMQYELLTGGMLGLVGNAAQIAIDPSDKVRFKDVLHPTGFNKIESLWNFVKRQMQEGQFNSHEADALLKTLGGAYREGKPMLARAMSSLGYSPDWVKEERTRQSVAALRNTLRRYNDEQGLGLKPPAFQSDYAASRHTPTAQSIVDALYRGDAAGAKKIFTDYINAAKGNPAEQKIRKDSITASVGSATPLKLGSKRNKDFATAFWKWAQHEGNVTPAQIADYKEVVNNFAKASYAAGFGKALQIVPETEGGLPTVTQKRARTAATDILREAIQKENIARALMAH